MVVDEALLKWAKKGEKLILQGESCTPEGVQESRNVYRASLVAQWLRICQLMQGTRVRALVWEDPTCRGATRPVSHNY